MRKDKNRQKYLKLEIKKLLREAERVTKYETRNNIQLPKSATLLPQILKTQRFQKSGNVTPDIFKFQYATPIERKDTPTLSQNMTQHIRAKSKGNLSVIGINKNETKFPDLSKQKHKKMLSLNIDKVNSLSKQSMKYGLSTGEKKNPLFNIKNDLTITVTPATQTVSCDSSPNFEFSPLTTTKSYFFNTSKKAHKGKTRLKLSKSSNILPKLH